MSTRLKFAVAGLAAGAVVATAGISSGAGGKSSSLLYGALTRNELRGVVVAETRPDSGKARVTVSINGLPKGELELVADTQPCSKLIDDTDIVWGIIMANTEGDFHFRRTTADLEQRLGAARSVRIYEEGESGQVACAPARKWVSR